MNSKRKAFQIFSDDIFLVSYPKSGSTWVRFLIGNYLSGNKYDFTNSHLIIPDVHYNPEQIGNLEKPRFIKSHYSFVPEYKRVIYIVRDVRDVAVSYFFHARKYSLIDKEMRFRDFVLSVFGQDKIDTLLPWGNHVNSYLENHENDLLLVRYEDLIDDTYRELARILDFSGLPLQQDKVASAVESSSFSKMQRMEQNQIEQFEQLVNSDHSIKFIRQGRVGVWQEWFDSELLQYIFKMHGDTLEKLGYIRFDYNALSEFSALKLKLVELQQINEELEVKILGEIGKKKQFKVSLNRLRKLVKHLRKQRYNLREELNARNEKLKILALQDLIC
ncbi:MAG: hypothetical protein F6K30_29855 [Cyanothece sp. SIO2G6]|nr:hypothetical protein [Cyanothece sp. SIO2G6]